MLIRTVLIVAISIVGGAITAAVQEVPWQPDVEAVRQRLATRTQAKESQPELASLNISFEQFEVFLAQGAVLIDARKVDAFVTEHVAAPLGSAIINVPPGAFDENIDRI